MSSQESLIILPKSNVINTTQKFENYQPIDTINYDHRGRNLLKLLQDIGAVVFDANNILVLSTFFTNNEQKNSISRILGYAAEGVVVRECNTNLSKNKKWANYARKLKQDSNAVMQLFKSIYYEFFLENPDDYIAIGTGFAITKTEYSHIYRRNSDRDICWVNKYNDAKQLLSIEGIKWNKQNFVGIQLKVSTATNGYYVTNYFKKKPYHQLYPVVYFALGGDFYKVKNNLIYIDRQTVKPNTLFSNEVNYGNYSHAEIRPLAKVRTKM